MSNLAKTILGNVPATTLAEAIDASELTIELASAANWPDGSDGPFAIKINRTGATEETILVQSRTGTTLTVVSGERGYDGTVPSAHNVGERVEHVFDGVSAALLYRLLSLLQTKGDVFGFNGVNISRVAAGDDDEMVLLQRASEGVGLAFDRLPVFTIDSNTPSVTGVRRLWFDSNLNALRVSNGASWLFQAGALAFADEAERELAVTDPVAGLIVSLDTGDDLRVLLHDGTDYIELARGDNGILRFVNEAARNAYWPTPLDGYHAYILDAHQLTEFRNDEWIVINQKITVSATQPTVNRQFGDIWIQPD